MTTASSPTTPPTAARTLLSRVPEVTLWFWIIKICATTVGETAADYLNVNLGFGLTGVSALMAAILAVVLAGQFAMRRYVPPVYWLAVVLISVVGTLITDNLTDNLGVSLTITTPIFAVLLAVVFAAWYRSEGTLSIHSIITARREAFYWLTILVTFALGTAAGDLFAERPNLGYGPSIGIFAGAIAIVAVAHMRFRLLGAVPAFWAAYVLTRPLGASIGDFMSQPKHDGGLALGTTGTSALYLIAIVIIVAYLTVTGRDQDHVAVEDHRTAVAID